eukprot:15293491-Ditylum_brightwellii.AAC.1
MNLDSPLPTSWVDTIGPVQDKHNQSISLSLFQCQWDCISLAYWINGTLIGGGKGVVFHL